MSSQVVEIPIVTAKATVMIYDDSSKKWMPSGSTPGISKVQLFQHTVHNTYRVVGRKIPDHEVVINCQITKGLRYNQANQTFLQWRDSKQVYGLNFQLKEDAESFSQALKNAVDNLTKAAENNGVSNGKRQTNESNGFYEDTDRYNTSYNAYNNNGAQNSINANIMRNVVSSPQLITNNNNGSNGNMNQMYNNVNQRKSSDFNNQYQQQFTQQTQQLLQQHQQNNINNNNNNYNDTNQKIYDVIQDSSYPSQNCTKLNGTLNGQSTTPQPTPPPPPPLSKEILFTNSDSRMNRNNTPPPPPGPPPPQGPPPPPALPNATVEQKNFVKPVQTKSEESKSSPKPMDFLTEIRMKIGKKNMENQESSSPPDNKSIDEYDSQKVPNYRKAQINVGSNMKQNFDSPKIVKKTPSNTSDNGHTNGHANDNNINYDKLKQDILTELRKEIQVMKTDIINAIVTELRRTYN